MPEVLTNEPWVGVPMSLITADISAQAFRVAIAILSHARPGGHAPFPSQKRLADMCHVSVPTIKRTVQELRSAGVLRCEQRLRENGSYTTSEYTLLMPRGSRMIPGPGITGDPTRKKSPAVPKGTPGTPRLADEIWDAVSKGVGAEPVSKAERSRRGKVTKELKELDASPGEIFARCKRWPMVFPGATLTDTALLAHWGRLGGPPRAIRAECPHCAWTGKTGDLKGHLYDKHDLGRLCPGCGQIIGDGDQHGCLDESS